MLFLLIATSFDSISSFSQQLKIGVFDIDSMVHVLPEYKVIDSLMLIYTDNSVGDYELLVKELSNMDDIYSHHFKYSDSSYKRFLDSIEDRRRQISFSIIYWKSNIEQSKKENARRMSEPLYRKVSAALEKIVKDQHYDLVLKLNSLQMGNNGDNLFIAVAKELHLSYLPDNLIELSILKIPALKID